MCLLKLCLDLPWLRHPSNRKSHLLDRYNKFPNKLLKYPVLDDGGFVEIYVDNNLVKDQYIENDPNNRNLFTKIDLENIKGRYIEYRSITSYPNHRHTALGEFTVDVK